MDNLNQVNDKANPSLLPGLPGATASLVLGIISIVLCWCWGIGLVLGIIGLILGIKAVNMYRESPGAYSESSFKNANAGKICSIIGLSLSALYVIYIIAMWSTNMEMIKSILGDSFDF